MRIPLRYWIALLLTLSVWQLARAQSVTPLTFDRPPAQGPGTPGSAFVSDPTIQPFVAPGMPAPLQEVAPVDLQGNGRPDLVGCHAVYPPWPIDKFPCRVLRPQPDGSIVDVTRQLFGAGALPSTTHPREIVSGDFNRDGRADIFVAAHGYDAAPSPGETNLLLISNADGTYTDRSATLPQVPDYSHSATVGDINGDGFLDIYVGNVFGERRVGPYFLMGKGDGSFTQKTSGLPPPIQSLQAMFMSCLLDDVDGDQSPDLVLGTHNIGGFSDNLVLFNDGAGDFTRRPIVVLPKGPLPADNFWVLDIVSLDVNRDGRADLLVLSAQKTDKGIGLQLLINQGNGTFVDESPARLGPSFTRLTGPYYNFIRLADFNGDGLQDFYLDQARSEDGSLYPRIWLNNGNGTLTPVAPSALPRDVNFSFIFAVDFDGDRRPDIAQLTGNSTSGLGYRTFLNRTVSPCSVAIAPTFGTVPAVGAAGSVDVTAPFGCAWTAASTAPTWLTVTAGSSGSGNGMVSYAAAANAGSARTGTLTIAGQTFTLNQDAAAMIPPTTVPDAYGTVVNTPLVIAAPGVLANDLGNGAPVLSAELAGTPSNGTVSLDANGAFMYTPNLGFIGADAFIYRAVSSAGRGNAAVVTLTVTGATTPPPFGLRTHAISGNRVTLRWFVPTAGPAPTHFVLEGGVNPGEVLGSLQTGSSVPTFTFDAPTGSFYVRMRAVSGTIQSATSNEIRIHVNVPVPPSSPANLLGLVSGGSTLSLAWSNTYLGGAATSLVLDVTGATAASVPLGLVDTFTFTGVPNGTYTFSLRAQNTGGTSPPSNSVTLTFPGGCSGPPLTPTNMFAYQIGRTIFVDWAPGASGPAPTSYQLTVSGSFTGSFPTSSRALSGTVGPGLYTLSVSAVNACGTSATTVPTTVVVP